ncbi:MAG: hypothetical protein RIR12_1865 [Bacteroidota bacterium]|jgi:hypothetical protein
MHNPAIFYKAQIDKLSTSLQQLYKRKTTIGWLRLMSMMGILAPTAIAIIDSEALWLPVTGSFIYCFIRLLYMDVNNNDGIRNHQHLLQINNTELLVLQHQFTQLPSGANHQPAQHAYANDLDMLGHSSLYQYINRTQTEQGAALLIQALLKPSDMGIILQRQEAVKELSIASTWRHQLQAYGITTPITLAAEEKIKHWLQSPLAFINTKYWAILRLLLPAIPFSLLGLHLGGLINANGFYSLIIVCLIGASLISKKVMPAYRQLEKIAPQLAALAKIVRWIEQTNFKADLLQKLSQQYLQPKAASHRIKLLQRILERLDIRLNPVVFIPLNTFLFWDLQQVLALEKWKKENLHQVEKWFKTLAEIELLTSLATFKFNNPHVSFPTFTNEPGVLIAKQLGHPLIPPHKMVRNSITIQQGQQLCLITGSNMAGKSTFLRSTGINIVLAMMGAPVDAAAFTLSPMQVLSSMRVTDNLEESTSTFYAELKKLKEVVDAVNKHQNVFLLLDEILRGTNSADRHTGSKALIHQLVKHKATGMLATHDIGLAQLGNEYPTHLHNYHFDVQIKADELYFDYQLKEGVCTSMNASLLMKKIGIELA